MGRFNPFHLGLVQWPAIVTVLATLIAYLLGGIAYPSPELMRSMAEIGATLFVAWVLEAVWMAANLQRDGDEREDWLGGAAGFGLAGLVGIAAALLVAEHRAAGHHNFLDGFGLWWSVIALSGLGVSIAMHPVIVDRWSRRDDDGLAVKDSASPS